MSNRMASLCVLVLAASGLLAPCSGEGENVPSYDQNIVEEGKGNAEIVICEKAVPIVKLAADELRLYIEKISGAKLPILNKPSAKDNVKIYVGKSEYTDRLGVNDKGLEFGAYRMVSGPSHLVLLGDDKVFHRNDMTDRLFTPRSDEDAWNKLWEEWYEKSKGNYGLPYSQCWKDDNHYLNINANDGRGSANAVYAFLRMQGTRWYMPGDLGEIVPLKKTIKLPKVNKTVNADFELRYPYMYGQRFGQGGEKRRDKHMWQLRMGFCQAPRLFDVGYIAHGLNFVTSIKGLAKRPGGKPCPDEFYAVSGDKRLVTTEKETGVPCFASEGLFRENVKFVRAMYDVFDAPMVSVMPCDGFTAICECEKCASQADTSMGWMGQYSDYVWKYVNKVAREVYKTHPDRKIVAMAYTTYLLPPKDIKTFSPNIIVCVAQGRTRFGVDEKARKFYEEVRAGYLAKFKDKHERHICNYEYYRYGVPKKNFRSLPAFFPRAISKDMQALKGVSYGDYIEVFTGEKSMAVTSLNLYATARCWWDADLDIDKLLDEYYANFFGPVRDEMKAFIEYSEKNWLDMLKDAEKIERCFELLKVAQDKVPTGSDYEKRIALIADYIAPMREIQQRLKDGRKDAKVLEIKDLDTINIKLDGKFDEDAWKGIKSQPLQKIAEGGEPENKTSFKVFWANDSLYFAIRCEDVDMKNIKVNASKPDDTNIWEGDCVELEIESPTHAYYQLAIAPNGKVTDLDREHGLKLLWSSNAQVGTFRDDKAWYLEIRIPVAGEMQEELDALNGLSGEKPSPEQVWYFNVCRQRPRDGVYKNSAFSPTGKSGFHVPMKFAKLIIRNGE